VQGLQKLCSSLHTDLTWSVGEACAIQAEGWQGGGNTSAREVSGFRTSEVCRRNLLWLSTLHNLKNRGWSFYLKIKVPPLVNHLFNLTFV